jgi:hypothetical protein
MAHLEARLLTPSGGGGGGEARERLHRGGGGQWRIGEEAGLRVSWWGLESEVLAWWGRRSKATASDSWVTGRLRTFGVLDSFLGHE